MTSADTPPMTPAATPALDVVVVNWNGGPLLRACLDSLAAAEAGLGDALSLRVVVVDNASRDGSLANLPRLRHGPEVIANPDNQGFGRACNAGAARGSAPAILFLNPDARVTPAGLAAAYAALKACIPVFGSARNPCDVTAQATSDPKMLASAIAAISRST